MRKSMDIHINQTYANISIWIHRWNDGELRTSREYIARRYEGACRFQRRLNRGLRLMSGSLRREWEVRE
jgi:hypothetical protein